MSIDHNEIYSTLDLPPKTHRSNSTNFLQTLITQKNNKE